MVRDAEHSEPYCHRCIRIIKVNGELTCQNNGKPLVICMASGGPMRHKDCPCGPEGAAMYDASAWFPPPPPPRC